MEAVTSGNGGLLPPPLWGRVGRGVVVVSRTCIRQLLPPPPTPPHKGRVSHMDLRRLLQFTEMDSEVDSPSTGGWRDSRRLFDGCRTPGRTTHAGCWRFCSLLLRRHCVRRGPLGMATFGQSKEGLLRLVLQLQHGVPSHDTFRRVFRLLDPQAFEAAFRRFMAGFAKANGLNCAVWWRWMAKPCAVPSSVAGKAPRCTWSTSGQRRRECAWLSAKLPAATRQRGRGSPGPAGPRRLYRYRGCTALPSRLCLHGARAGADYVLALRRTRASCSLRPLGAMRAAEPAALPNGANPPLTIAASGGARPSCAIPLSPRSRVPRRRCAGPHHLAPPRARCLCGASPVRYFLLSKYIPAKQLLRIVRSH